MQRRKEEIGVVPQIAHRVRLRASVATPFPFQSVQYLSHKYFMLLQSFKLFMETYILIAIRLKDLVSAIHPCLMSTDLADFDFNLVTISDSLDQSITNINDAIGHIKHLEVVGCGDYGDFIFGV